MSISEKASIFNNFFASQCTVIPNASKLSVFSVKTNCKLNNIIFTENDIISIIRSLVSNKAHGCDDVSIRMIKICDEAIVLPLKIIFKIAMQSGTYPDQWKKANIIPIHKKGSKNLLENYRPISLLPNFSKIFEKCIYNSMYSYFECNNLFTSCQSGFHKHDSCVSQILAITRAVFLDISKAFDRVWHEGLLFKLKSYGINGSLLKLIASFLSNRLQRVVLNGNCSTWKEVLAAVPQGSILGPLFFLIFINDLPIGLQSNVKIFADDTSLFSVIFYILSSSNILNNDLALISDWAFQWKMSFIPDPSKKAAEVVFSSKSINTQLPSLTFYGSTINPIESHKHLGMILDKKLSFNHHIKEKICKANKGIGMINRL